jgi:hypothetical protein
VEPVLAELLERHHEDLLATLVGRLSGCDCVHLG